MKTIFTLLAVAMTLAFSSVQAQDCSDLLISEVVEGWSNNKAVEIYNPTSEAVDASEYGLVRFQNGNTEPGNVTYLEGITIEPFDSYVVVIDKRDPDGTSFEAPVWDELELVGDAFINPAYNDGVEAMYFNGNDAIALLKDGGNALVDVFGKIGDSVNADGWGGYIDSNGEQAYVSQDHTLIRKANIMQGYTTNPSTFTILNEYDSLPANTFTSLGWHVCDCDAGMVGVNELESINQLKLFPNPVQNGFVTITATSAITQYEVFSLTGQAFRSEVLGSVQSAYIDLTEIPAGTYYIKARLESGVEVNEVLIKK
ncbi:MAG: lamin tail domain-containing protein [Flavobacteriales bacterium]